MDYYENCTLCPRECGVNRKVKKGYCRSDGRLTAARAALHMWEEPCISGKNGSGTVFFSGCGLGCIYCQNREISKGNTGLEITSERLAEIFLELQDKKANNINLVTPTHFVPHIKDAIDIAKRQNLKIPILYNSSGYEKVETLKMLDGYVDIYLPDFKYIDRKTAKEYSNAADYPEFAKPAVAEMVRQRGRAKFNSDGIMTSGVIIRHLLLPGRVNEAKKIVKYLFETYGDTVYISLMNQYTPIKQVENDSLLRRRVTEKEYEELIDYAVDTGVENGFIQEGGTASESFIPQFDCTGIKTKEGIDT